MIKLLFYFTLAVVLLVFGCQEHKPSSRSIYCDNGFIKENALYLRFHNGDIEWVENDSRITYKVPPGVTCSEAIPKHGDGK